MPPDDDPPKLHPKRLGDENGKCPKHGRAGYRELIELAWAAGWWCERANTNYIKCYPPDNKRMVVVPSTPSGTRTLANKRAQFRRSGLDV